MLVGILIIVVSGFCILNVLAYGRAHDMMYFTDTGPTTSRPESLTFIEKVLAVFVGIQVRRPTSALDPEALAANCRRIPVTCEENITLDTWYCDRGSDTRLAILFHGYTREKTALLNEAKTFLELELSVLLVDFRGSGESSEAYTSIGFDEAVDVSRVVQYAENILPHSSIILFGQSMGAVAIMRAIKELGVEPDAVIAEAVFDTMLNTVRNRFKEMRLPSFPCAELLVFWGGKHTGFNAFTHNPIKYAPSIRCPILFMHGSNDERATIEEGRRVYDAVPGMKTFKEFSDAGHESYAESFPDEWKNTVAKFATHLNPEKQKRWTP